MEQMLKNLELLGDLPGVSGCEDPVRDAILGQIEDHCESWQVDALGNLLVHKKGAAPAAQRLLLTAHMDEVGFIVTHIEEDGLLRFAAVGGIDSRVVVGKAVEVGPRRLYGVIGSKAVHLQEEKEKDEALKLDKLFIDIGATCAETAGEHVRVGDRAVFYAPFLELGDQRVLGRAFDDRAGCALLVELIRSELPCDCHFAFTVQEETGCTGAVAAGYSVDPDIAIVVEATTASDIAGVPPEKAVCRLGGGPVISFMDKGAVYDRGLVRLVLDTAGKHGIPVQVKEGVYGGNESRSIQTARDGVRTVAVSLPCRYLHSPSNVLQAGDITHTRDLLFRLIEAAGAL